MPPKTEEAPTTRTLESVLVGLREFAKISGANELRDTYLSLSEKERERVWNFVNDSRRRDREQGKAFDYTPIEGFVMFLWESSEGNAPEQIQAELGLSPEQHLRLVAAWEAIRTVDAELWADAEKELAEMGAANGKL